MKEYITLGDACSKGSSNIAQKDIEANNGRYPIYGASGYIKNVDFYHQGKPYIAVVKDGAGIGRTMLLPKESSVIGTMQYLIPNDTVCVEYLYYAVSYMNLSKYFTGATIPHIYFKDYQKEKLPLLTIDEQRKKADNLQKIDRLIELCSAILGKLDVLVKSRFVEMFGDIAKSEYKFPTYKLGEVAEVGSSHRVFTTEFVESGIPFYRGTEIGELANGNKPTEPFYISKEHYKRIANDNTKPKIGDLLMPSICNKGQVWMVDTDEPFYYKDGRVLCISVDRTKYNTRFFQIFMREKTIIEYPKLGSGSTFAEFKIFLLKNIDVLMPPLALQNQFAAFVEQTDKSKYSAEKIIKLIRKVKFREQF
jgi:type I restriction enzyme S subunit